MKYPAILGELYGKPHVILPEKLDSIRRFIEARSAGITIDGQAVPKPSPYLTTEFGAAAPIEAIGNSGSRKFVAVLPLFGTLFQHGDMAMDASGGTSTEQFADEFSKLIATPSVKAIVIETHSPGGQVYGTQELSDLIFAARQRKRVVAVVNSMAASAALWVSTAASEVNITSGGEMGSIGVVTMHTDVSGAEEKEGVKTTLIAYPEKKIEGHEFAPLSDDVRADIESRIKQTYQRFVSAVARNRGVSTAVVESRFGGGGMLRAQQAVAAGLADRVATKHQVLAREVQLMQGGGERKSVRNRLAIAQANGEL